MKSKNQQQMTRTEYCKLANATLHPAQKVAAAMIWGVWGTLLLALTVMATGAV